MGEIINPEQVERLKQMLKVARDALDDIYQDKRSHSPQAQAAEALDTLDQMRKWEDGQ
jgi:hypothetical protein